MRSQVLMNKSMNVFNCRLVIIGLCKLRGCDLAHRLQLFLIPSKQESHTATDQNPSFKTETEEVQLSSQATGR